MHRKDTRDGSLFELLGLRLAQEPERLGGKESDHQEEIHLRTCRGDHPSRREHSDGQRSGGSVGLKFPFLF